jgi:hypothetical protein
MGLYPKNRGAEHRCATATSGAARVRCEEKGERRAERKNKLAEVAKIIIEIAFSALLLTSLFSPLSRSGPTVRVQL